MQSNYQLTWIQSGTLYKLETCFNQGVYIFVYHGIKKRIIYAGTAASLDGFTGRWCEHLKLFNIGGRAVWRPDKNEDVYNLMSFKDGKKPDYCLLCHKGKIWVNSNKKNDEGFYDSCYDIGKSFKENWRDYVINEYLDRISVWRCNIKDPYVAKILESKIQMSLGKYFNLTFYNTRPQNWLGKMEIRDIQQLSKYTFSFNNLPEVDLSTADVLKNLQDYL